MSDPIFIFFADLMKLSIMDAQKRQVGQFWDLGINLLESYPPVTSLIIKRGIWKKSFAEVQWSQVDRINHRIYLKPGVELSFTDRLPIDAFRIRKDVLDQQVVDTYNHKVIRVNDAHMLYVNHMLRIVHVDIGAHGLVRRLGWETLFGRLLKVLYPKAKYFKNVGLISWKYVKTITLDPRDPIHMDLTAKQLEKIPPADLGEIMMDLDIHQRVALFRTADPHHRARLFERLGFEQQEQLLEHLDTREAVELLSKMSADEAVDLLGEMPAVQGRQLLSLMESGRAKKLSMLLGFEEDEAGSIMTTEYLEIPKGLTVQASLALIKENTPELETIYYLYVVDENKQLMGTTTLRRLIAIDPNTLIESTVFPKPVFVYSDSPIKEVAFLMDKYKVSALPVVNKQRNLQGIITVDDVLHHVIPIAWRRRAGRKHP